MVFGLCCTCTAISAWARLLAIHDVRARTSMAISFLLSMICFRFDTLAAFHGVELMIFLRALRGPRPSCGPILPRTSFFMIIDVSLAAVLGDLGPGIYTYGVAMVVDHVQVHRLALVGPMGIFSTACCRFRTTMTRMIRSCGQLDHIRLDVTPMTAQSCYIVYCSCIQGLPRR